MKMKYGRMANKKNLAFSTYNSAFSLVELLVVISIIGVLAALALISFTGSQQQARDTRRKSDLNQYHTALESYGNGNNGLFPSRTSVCTVTNISNCICGDLGLASCEEDPRDGVDPSYIYEYISNGGGSGNPTATEFVLWSVSEKNSGYWVVCSSGNKGLSAAQPSTSTCPL